MTRRKSAKRPLSEANQALEVSEDNKLRKIGLEGRRAEQWQLATQLDLVSF